MGNPLSANKQPWGDHWVVPRRMTTLKTISNQENCEGEEGPSVETDNINHCQRKVAGDSSGVTPAPKKVAPSKMEDGSDIEVVDMAVKKVSKSINSKVGSDIEMAPIAVDKERKGKAQAPKRKRWSWSHHCSCVSVLTLRTATSHASNRRRSRNRLMTWNCTSRQPPGRQPRERFRRVWNPPASEEGCWNDWRWRLGLWKTASTAGSSKAVGQSSQDIHWIEVRWWMMKTIQMVQFSRIKWFCLFSLQYCL